MRFAMIVALPFLVLATPPPASELERARALLARVPLIDGHNDLPWQIRERWEGEVGAVLLDQDLSHLEPPLHTDLERLRQAGVGAKFWSVWVPVGPSEPQAVVETLEQIDVVKRLVERYPEHLELAWSAVDIERIHAAGRVASLIGVEGGHSIAESLGVLRQLRSLGARYLTLTHSESTAWADSGTGERLHGGLTPFGVEVVRELNRLGMLVDLSHVSEEVMHQALDLSAAPVIFSHSSAKALTPHPRNVPDDVLERLPENGGVVMVTFVPSFVSTELYRAEQAERSRLETRHPESPERVVEELRAWRRGTEIQATLADVADHIDHVRRVAGIDHVGIGSDFDGISSVPEGLESVDRLPHLVAELLRRGYSEAEVEKVVGRNLLRVLEAADRVSGMPPP